MEGSIFLNTKFTMGICRCFRARKMTIIVLLNLLLLLVIDRTTARRSSSTSRAFFMRGGTTFSDSMDDLIQEESTFTDQQQQPPEITSATATVTNEQIETQARDTVDEHFITRTNESSSQVVDSTGILVNELSIISSKEEDTIIPQHFNNDDDSLQTTNNLQGSTVNNITFNSNLSSVVTTTSATTLAKHTNNATALRQAGKECHDARNYSGAAAYFCAAADCFDVSDTTAVVERATCRLHEALCRLKACDYPGATLACDKVIASQEAPAPLRARAFHRRAKAYLQLHQNELALADARSAAFLGDTKAVALYGTLMRESSLSSSVTTAVAATKSKNGASSKTDALLLDTLLRASEGQQQQQQQLPSFDAFGEQSPMSLLLSNMMQTTNSQVGGSTGKNSDGLAKSVLSALAKRLDDAQTQTTICNVLRTTSAPQLQGMAAMAGIQLQATYATKLANFLNQITPQKLKSTVKWTKHAVRVARLAQLAARALKKYASLLLLVALLSWIKSALLRPIPVSRKAILAAAKAAVANKEVVNAFVL
jgi:hypothetical protein